MAATLGAARRSKTMTAANTARPPAPRAPRSDAGPSHMLATAKGSELPSDKSIIFPGGNGGESLS